MDRKRIPRDWSEWERTWIAHALLRGTAVQPVSESGGPPDRIENTGLDRCRRKRSHAAPATNRRGHEDPRRRRATRLGVTHPEPPLIVRNAGEAGGEPVADPSSNAGRRRSRRVGVGRPGRGAWAKHPDDEQT